MLARNEELDKQALQYRSYYTTHRMLQEQGKLKTVREAPPEDEEKAPCPPPQAPVPAPEPQPQVPNEDEAVATAIKESLELEARLST